MAEVADPPSSGAGRTARERQHMIEIELSSSNTNWEALRGLRGLHGVSPSWTDPETGITTLHKAAYGNEADILEWTLSDGVLSIDAKSGIGRTPLHMACDAGTSRCIKILLRAHANPNARTLAGLTPLHLAVRSDDLEGLQALLESEEPLDMDVEDDERMTAEMYVKSKQIEREMRLYRAKRKQILQMQELGVLFDDLFHIVIGENSKIQPSQMAVLYSAAVEFFTKKPPTLDEAQQFFGDSDSNRDGLVDKEEFQRALLELVGKLGVDLTSHAGEVRGCIDFMKAQLCGGAVKSVADFFSAEDPCDDAFANTLRLIALSPAASEALGQGELHDFLKTVVACPGPRGTLLLKGPGSTDGEKVMVKHNPEWEADLLDSVRIAAHIQHGDEETEVSPQ